MFPSCPADQQLTERYRYIRTLGHGAFGEVLLAEDVTNGRHVAAKQLYLPEPGAPLPRAVAREVAALQQLQHPNIIALLDVVVSGCCVYLCQELCDTDLAVVLAGADHQLPPRLVCSVMQQLLAALAACHAAGIMHRDIKPSNILVSASGTIRIADFGLATCVDGGGSGDRGPDDSSTRSDSAQPPAQSSERQQQQRGYGGAHTPGQGTRWYRAPELLFGSCSYGPAVDVWAAGVVFAEMLGLSPFIPGQSDIDQLARMQQALGSITPQAWPGVQQLPDWHKVSFAHTTAQRLGDMLPDAPAAALDLLQQLLCYDPERRLPAAAALQHSYFAGLQLRSGVERE